MIGPNDVANSRGTILGYFRGTVDKGKKPVEGIPVPPFARPQQKRDFVSALQMFVAHLNEGEQQGLSQYAMNAALEAESYAMKVTDKEEFDPYPSRTVFAVACAVRFPAPWTPEGIAALLKEYGRRGHRLEEFHTVSAGTIEFGIDPVTVCQRHGDNGWTVTSNERGHVRMAARPADDFAMVMYLMDQGTGHSGPYHGQYNERIGTELRQPAQAVMGEWGKFVKNSASINNWLREWPRPS